MVESMVMLSTLPLFDEPATPSAKRSPDDKRGSASDEERQEHVARLKAADELTYDPVADLNRGWWETLTLTDALTALARYEREAQQAQSLAASLDQFDELDTYDFDSDGFVAPADDRW